MCTGLMAWSDVVAAPPGTCEARAMVPGQGQVEPVDLVPADLRHGNVCVVEVQHTSDSAGRVRPPAAVNAPSRSVKLVATVAAGRTTAGRVAGPGSSWISRKSMRTPATVGSTYGSTMVVGEPRWSSGAPCATALSVVAARRRRDRGRANGHRTPPVADPVMRTPWAEPGISRSRTGSAQDIEGPPTCRRRRQTLRPDERRVAGPGDLTGCGDDRRRVAPVRGCSASAAVNGPAGLVPGGSFSRKTGGGRCRRAGVVPGLPSSRVVGRAREVLVHQVRAGPGGRERQLGGSGGVAA